jgi:anaerobic dimethyl sulfoxide reductase subunit A
MGKTEVITTSCGHDCGGRCVLKVHVRDGKAIRIETDDGEEPQLRACLRGRAQRKLVYAADRLQYPMKRAGARGEGNFEKISWDEALDTVASELVRVKNTYGNASIILLGGKGTGNQGALHQRSLERLLDKFGGYTQPWADAAFEGPMFGSMATYGTLTTGNAWEDLLNSNLIILWGWNPAATIWDTNTTLVLARAKENGTKIISVNPMYNESTAAFASEWIAVRPGTDVAMLIAMAHVMIANGLQDQKFLDTYTVGFDKFRDYVLGTEDGIPKTPAWAEEITGVPRATIERLAAEYATTKPAALVPGWAPARSDMGEQFTRAASTLCAMTGNIGKPGGHAGGFLRAFHNLSALRKPRDSRNPVEQ